MITNNEVIYKSVNSNGILEGYYEFNNNNISLSCNQTINGECNTISGYGLVIGGGRCNSSRGNYSIIAGGCGNRMSYATASFIGGGFGNSIDKCYSSILGGICNSISGDQRGISPHSIIGGYCNLLGFGAYNIIGQGYYNAVYGVFNTIINGQNNKINSGDSTCNNFLGAGVQNNIGSNSTSAKFSSIINGNFNAISGTIAENECSNVILFSNILGGQNNWISSDYSTILGGKCNNVYHLGSTVIGDGASRVKNSMGACTLSLDFINGTYIKNKVIINTSSPLSSNSAGTSGEIAFDNNYFYRHNGINWTRTAMSTW